MAASGVLAGEADLPASLHKELLEQLGARPYSVHTLSLRNELSRPLTVALIEGDNRSASLAVAVGVWAADPRGIVPSELQELWRRAILTADAEPEDKSSRYTLAEILKQSKALAFDWLLEHIQRGDIPVRLIGRPAATEPFQVALSVLDGPQRRQLLEHIQPGLGTNALLVRLVGRDLDLYRALLENEPLQAYHLAPMAGMPDAAWVPLAAAAIEAGYPAQEIVRESDHQSHGWSGSGASYWSKWEHAFAALESDTREEIREIGRQGKDWFGGLVREREEEEQRIARDGLV